jgi:hypothetical protein
MPIRDWTCGSKAVGGLDRQIRRAITPRADGEALRGPQKGNNLTAKKNLYGRLPGDRTGNRRRWAGRVSQGARENCDQGTRQNDPVTSGEGMPDGVKPSRRKHRRAAENRPKRLFTKNTGLC